MDIFYFFLNIGKNLNIQLVKDAKMVLKISMNNKRNTF